MGLFNRRKFAVAKIAIDDTNYSSLPFVVGIASTEKDAKRIAYDYIETRDGIVEEYSLRSVAELSEYLIEVEYKSVYDNKKWFSEYYYIQEVKNHTRRW